MKFTVLDKDVSEGFDPKAQGLIAQGACDAGLLFASASGVIPEGCREATSEEVQQSHLYKARKNALNTQREDAITSGVEVADIGTFDTDQDAQLRIAGALMLSMLPIFRSMYGVMYSRAEAEGDTETMDTLSAARTAFQVPWVLKDNTRTTLGFDEFKIIGPAVSQHVAEQVHTARAKKDSALQSILNPVSEEEEAEENTTEEAPAAETADTSESSEVAQ